MTTLLALAFPQTSELPDYIQNEIANELLEKIEFECRWDKRPAESQDTINLMAQKAIEEFQAGKIKKMGRTIE
jgi:hypothetical protein